MTRTGVNTGEVIVGGGAADQKLATGDAVNVAARLEQAAAPGEVLLGEATHSAVAHAVVAEQAPPIAAKGKSEALVAYRLVGLRPDVPAFARPISTPFVGRRREARRPPSRIRRRGPRARLRPHDGRRHAGNRKVAARA